MKEIKAVITDRIINRPAAWVAIVPVWIFDYSDKLGSEGVAIYTALCAHANKERRCYPSQETLAREAGCSVDTVRRRVNSMLELGLLRVVYKGDGRGKATVYEIADFLQRVAPSKPLDLKGSCQPDKGLLPAAERVAGSHPNNTNNNTSNNGTNNLSTTDWRTTEPTAYTDATREKFRQQSMAALGKAIV